MKTGSSKWVLAAGAAALCVTVVAALLWYPPYWQKNYPAAGDARASFAELGDGKTVNLNTAQPVQLALLPGIGEAKAEAIVAFRAENGPFAVLDDLLEVPGIGPTVLADLDGLVSF